MGSHVKRAIRRNGRSYTIDLLETRRQVEAGTLPAVERRMIERIMGVLPSIDPLSGKLTTAIDERTTHPNPQTTPPFNQKKKGDS